MYSATMHHLPFPVLSINKDGIITEANKAALLITGEKQSIVGQAFQNIFRFVQPDRPSELEASLVNEIQNGHELLAEYVTLNRRNAPVNFIVNTVAVKDEVERLKGVYCFLLPIPKQRGLKYKFEVLSSLTQTISSKCAYTKAHSNRVAHLSLYIGIKLGLPNRQLKLLFLAALLHDIGKIGISEQILNKEGPLTETEFQAVKKHTLIGARIIYPVSSLKPLAPIILYHHERYDGRGYPCGLAGEKIPLLSRIVSVADAFEAMTFDRCYRKKLPYDMAVAELVKNAGTQFDPHIVEAFTANVSNENYPFT